MDYLTTTELSREWNISSRMIAYYCESDRIAGAVKKGKSWLIPMDAKKPISKQKLTATTLELEENIAVKGFSTVHNKMENDIDYLYYTGEMFNNLGITRDTLRYYEKIGLLSPKRKTESTFREFDRGDIFKLMIIDFHKKRGFDALEIKELMEESKHQNSSSALEEKAAELEQSIYNQQCNLKRLQETKKIYDNANSLVEKFEIRDMPLFSVLKSFDDMFDISNYNNGLALEGEDILSSLVRVVSVGDKGYLGSKFCIVKKEEHKDSDKVYLDVGKSLHIISVAPYEDKNFAEEIFLYLRKVTQEYHLEPKGVAYCFVRYAICDKNIGQKIYELWIPIK